MASAKPIQKPAPPIWIDTTGDKEYLLRGVAAYADAWDKLYLVKKAQETTYVGGFKRDIQFIKEEARRLGRNPEAIRHSPGSLVMAIGKDDQQTRKLADEYSRSVWHDSSGSPSSGHPERVIAYLSKLVEAGAMDFTLNFVPHSIPETIGMMELFAKEGIPAFKKCRGTVPPRTQKHPGGAGVLRFAGTRPPGCS